MSFKFSFKTLIVVSVLSILIIGFSCNRKSSSKNLASSRTAWSHYGGSPDQSKFFYTSQINKKNVGQLQVAWTYPTDDNGFLMFSPIVVDTIMYVFGNNSSLVALNVLTGKEIWIHTGLQGMARRGINYWESADKTDRRLIFTLNNTIQAINALTGKTITSFGTNGYVDMRIGLDRDPTSIRRMQAMMPGVIFENLIIMGSAPGEDFFSPPGYVRAYNVVTGKLEWTFHTIPHPGEFGYETWPKDAYKYVGGVNVWSEISVDKERGIAYLPLGSPTYDYYGGDREGANLFGNSLVALDARTGKRIWHYQTVHHDLWDYDLPSAPQLLTVKRNGKKIDAVAVGTKHGFVFVFDRVTGEPVFPIEEKAFPQSEMPGEKSWPTQPIPSLPSFTRHEVTKENLNPYFSEEEKQKWYKRIDAAKSGLFVPPSDKYETIMMTGALGGASYGNTASNPQKGMLYLLSQDYASVYKLSKVAPPRPALSKEEADKAQAFYEVTCQSCHGKNKEGGLGPALTNAGQRLGYDEFKTITTQGKGRMPGFVHVEESMMNALYRYFGGVPNRPNFARRAAPPARKMEGPVVDSGGAEVPADARQGAPMTDYPEGVARPEARYTTGYGTDWQALTAGPWASIFAYDLNTGTIKWRQPIGLDSAFSKGDKSNGAPAGVQRKGMVVTSTGVVFATGKGGIVYAFDADNGKVLWETRLGSETGGQPAMFTINGKEYLVVNATTNFARDSYNYSNKGAPRGYVVYALPEKTKRK